MGKVRGKNALLIRLEHELDRLPETDVVGRRELLKMIQIERNSIKKRNAAKILKRQEQEAEKLEEIKEHARGVLLQFLMLDKEAGRTEPYRADDFYDESVIALAQWSGIGDLDEVQKETRRS